MLLCTLAGYPWYAIKFKSNEEKKKSVNLFMVDQTCLGQSQATYGYSKFKFVTHLMLACPSRLVGKNFEVWTSIADPVIHGILDIQGGPPSPLPPQKRRKKMPPTLLPIFLAPLVLEFSFSRWHKKRPGKVCMSNLRVTGRFVTMPWTIEQKVFSIKTHLYTNSFLVFFWLTRMHSPGNTFVFQVLDGSLISKLIYPCKNHVLGRRYMCLGWR